MKKIISISIIGMFLLTGLVSLSAAREEIEESEKSSIPMSPSGELGCKVIYVGIRIDTPFERWFTDATVTATSIDEGMVYGMEYCERYGITGYWLEDIPTGDYLFKAKRGLMSGTTVDDIAERLNDAVIELKFINNMRMHDDFTTNPTIYLFYQFLGKQ